MVFRRLFARKRKEVPQPMQVAVHTVTARRATGTHGRSVDYVRENPPVKERPAPTLALVSDIASDEVASPSRLKQVKNIEFKTDKICGEFDHLPKAARMYGSHKRDGALTKDQRELLGALIHSDNHITVLVTPEAQRTAHMTKGFINAVGQIGRVKTVMQVTTPVLASAYAHYAESSADDGSSTSPQVANSRARMFALDMVNRAIDADASDIHLEVRDNKSAKVRFRVDGDMEDIQEHTRAAEIEVARKMSSVLFQGSFADDRSRSNTQSSENVIQHALVRIPELRNIALRYQTVLDKDGFDLVLRLLTYDGKSQTLLELSEMGFEPDQIEWMIQAITRPYGASFMGGSTGAGKTTTMAGLMHADPLKKTRKRYTAEDPVEIDMEDVTQCPIPRAANDISDGPFVEVLKAFLRADPDLLMVGEIRERATASVMMQLALTGHNVWATLHINRMFDALYRLTDPALGISPRVLGSDTALNLISSQTLVKTLCPHCRVPALEGVRIGLASEKTVEALARFGADPANLYVANRATKTNRNVCEHCGGKGEKGRSVCAELTLLDDELKDLIANERFDEVEHRYRLRRKTGFAQDGMVGKTMLDHAILKANRGQICAERVASVGNKSLLDELAARQYRGYLNV